MRSNPEIINNHEWKFFLKLEKGNIKDYVNKVEVLLDPTFGDVALVLRSAPFEIKRIGYGTFTLGVKIFF